MIKKVGMSVVAFSFVTLSTTSVAFATSGGVTISGNGSKTTNKVKLTTSMLSSLSQKNKTIVTLSIQNSAKTGGNEIKNTTAGSGGVSGDPSITTGSVTQNATVTVTGGANVGTNNPCSCTLPDPNVTISGNGDSSKNTVTVNTVNATETTQKNSTIVMVGIDQMGKTGGNEIKNTTGSATVSIESGSVDQSATVTVGGSVNTTDGSTTL